MKYTVLILTTLLSVACLSAQSRQHYAHVVRSASEFASIDRIEMSDDTFCIVLQITAHQGAALDVTLYPPGMPSSPILETYSHKLPMLRSEGIAIYPDQTRLDRDSVMYVKLYFESLPIEVTRFNLVEPNLVEDGTFNQYGVQLSRAPDRLVSHRFLSPRHFEVYFAGALKEYEGFWVCERSVRVKSRHSAEPATYRREVDTLASVYEDGRYRLYHLDGHPAGTEWRITERGKIVSYQDYEGYDFKDVQTEPMDEFSYDATLPRPQLKALLPPDAYQKRDKGRVAFRWQRVKVEKATDSRQ